MFLQDHYTPLFIASAKGFNDVVESLIAANAGVNFVSKVRLCNVTCHADIELVEKSCSYSYMVN